MSLPRKSELAETYGYSSRQLGVLMNTIYYDELVEVGYHKKMITLPAKVVRKFMELEGVPFSPTELEAPSFNQTELDL